MSINYGNDWEYANSRLSDTIVLKDKIPVYVYRVGSNGVVEYRTLGDFSKEGNCSISDLDLTPLALGFLNTSIKTSYLYRVPTRNWKQGLRLQQIHYVEGSRNKEISVDSQSFINCLLGIYPNLTRCVENIHCEEAIARAFSRTFSLEKGRKEIELVFKDTRVGYFSEQENRLKLWEKFSFLQESLDGVLNGRR